VENYAVFGGRATRAEYWYAFLINIIIGVVAGLLVRVPFFRVIIILFSLAGLLPGCSVFVRRLHDVGKSGKLWFAMVVPVVLGYVFIFGGLMNASTGLIIFGSILCLISLPIAIYVIVQLAKQGTFGANQYGADPRGGIGYASMATPPPPTAYAETSTTSTPPTSSGICGRCGIPAKPATHFCGKCGNKLD
jgi:uncharacterized membrane protein YhaH (DUF805 family)